jgi:hypothetical protein
VLGVNVLEGDRVVLRLGGALVGAPLERGVVRRGVKTIVTHEIVRPRRLTASR